MRFIVIKLAREFYQFDVQFETFESCLKYEGNDNKLISLTWLNDSMEELIESQIKKESKLNKKKEKKK